MSAMLAVFTQFERELSATNRARLVHARHEPGPTRKSRRKTPLGEASGLSASSAAVDRRECHIGISLISDRTSHV
jgi:hypothetical protein